jgi:Cu/Ag efflux protein CusF
MRPARTTRPWIRRRAWASMGAALLVAGCASYELPPLAVSHPAHPDAGSAPEPARSRTLAYAPADIPAFQPVAPLAAAAAPSPASEPAPPGAAATRTVVGEGEVVATTPGSSQLVVDHGVIEGFMEAMTMGYRVDPPSLLTGLKAGDKVRFTIDVSRRAIVTIEKLD